jgi:DNA-binding PadR family transcriptional regulator
MWGARGQSQSNIAMVALLRMESGPVYANQLGALIANRTLGRWRPVKAEIRAAMQRLSERGWIRSRRIGGRLLYYSTPTGRDALEGFRETIRESGEENTHQWRVFELMLGEGQVGVYLIGAFRHHLRIMEEELWSPESSLSAQEREHMKRELRAEVVRLHRQLTAVGEGAPDSPGSIAGVPRAYVDLSKIGVDDPTRSAGGPKTRAGAKRRSGGPRAALPDRAADWTVTDRLEIRALDPGPPGLFQRKAAPRDPIDPSETIDRPSLAGNPGRTRRPRRATGSAVDASGPTSRGN